MNEKLPKFAEINFDGEIVGATRDNTVVYTHLGKSALYDHVFINHPNGEVGAYVWAQSPPENDNFVKLLDAARKHECIMHVNLQQPSEQDRKAFIKSITRDVENFNSVPEDWV